MEGPLPEWCAQYIGIPYKTGGRDRDGIDCWGLVNLVWREQFGIDLPDYDGPLWHPNKSTAREVSTGAAAYSALFRPVPQGEERCGDGILFRMRGYPLHLAIVVAPGFMMHVEDNADTCVERYAAFQWQKRIIDFYRYE